MSTRSAFLALAALAFGAPLLTARPFFGDVDPEPVAKCCKPASIAPPTSGCTTSCRPTVTCAHGTRAGSITDGKCQPSGEECTLTTGLSTPKPLFACLPQPCTLADGNPGSQCVWTLAGGSPTENVTFTDCSGTPCGS